MSHGLGSRSDGEQQSPRRFIGDEGQEREEKGMKRKEQDEKGVGSEGKGVGQQMRKREGELGD